MLCCGSRSLTTWRVPHDLAVVADSSHPGRGVSPAGPGKRGWGHVIPPLVDSRPAVVYRFRDVQDALLYVGITVDLGNRLNGHAKEKPWWREAITVTLSHHPDIESAREEELRAIRTERPKYNVANVPAPPQQMALLPPSWSAMQRKPTEQERQRAQTEGSRAFQRMWIQTALEGFTERQRCTYCECDFDSLTTFMQHLPECLGVSGYQVREARKSMPVFVALYGGSVA
jgi:predicted GIY-YIG superfamily endonuclease